MTNVQQQVLEAIDRILKACQIAQGKKYEATIAKETESIAYLRSSVVSRWPLSSALKSDIAIGRYAVANLEDWIPELANPIMTLDYVLKHDGIEIDKLLAETAQLDG